MCHQTVTRIDEGSILRHRMKTLAAGALLLALTALFPAWASDLAKEGRWAEQVVQQLFDGEAVWLDADGTEFLGLYMEPAGEPKGAVVLMHGVGVHPDWPQVINPLRVGLAGRGWRTLSIQLPVLPNEATFEEYVPLYPEAPARIEAALTFLGGVEGPVFLIGHSMGTSMALYYMMNGGRPAVAGLVLIGANSGGEGSTDPQAELLAGARVPTLDLYGENDLVPVLTGLEVRAAVVAQTGNTDYLQVEVPEADHFYDGYEPQLLDAVESWLDQRR